MYSVRVDPENIDRICATKYNTLRTDFYFHETKAKKVFDKDTLTGTNRFAFSKMKSIVRNVHGFN